MVGQLGDVKSMFEVKCTVHVFPVIFTGMGNPGLPFFVIHCSKGFGNDRVSQGGGDFSSKGCIKSSDVVVVGFSLEEDDLPIVIRSVHFILLG